ncbi:D-alanine--D-alanine ligase family protein [Allobacillus halotolerans]|uniref:D-alanine--D-alanine ligase n=1 Tax=Allobacillus halotolerans TaxID=570278 RepID=A0ABS6GSK1_9BACI|nr:D-alanine--D-alanine ligase [Allobacillus halotolerans]MBU6081881.1 D-alanine--D-alanine ligase [Allobacillus halotolerans]
MKILVIYGGESSEREVSLKTGKGIYESLIKQDYNASLYDFKINQLNELIVEIGSHDLIYIALHGKDGEDGKIQALLQLLGKPYIGSDHTSSSLAINKSLTKEIANQKNIPTANFLSISNSDDLNLKLDTVNSNFSYPIIVKPNREGSSFGFSIIKEKSDLEKSVNNAFKYDKEILIEDYVKGQEFTVAILDDDGPVALPVIQIIPKNEYYDFESKYTEGGSEHVCPANIETSLEKSLKEYAINAHKALGCRHYSRVDFIVTDQMEIFMLEVNTLPGMTPTSLFPDAANAYGLNYDQLISHLIKLAKN